MNIIQRKYYTARSLGALRALTSSWRPFGPLDFVLRALRALRPCDPRIKIGMLKMGTNTQRDERTNGRKAEF